MKRATITLLAAVSLFGFNNPGFSQQDRIKPDNYDEHVYTDEALDNQENIEYIRGRIVSIDDKKNEIIIEQDQTHDKRTLMVPAERLRYFKIKDHVKIWVKRGENTVQDIQKIRAWHPRVTPQ